MSDESVTRSSAGADESDHLPYEPSKPADPWGTSQDKRRQAEELYNRLVWSIDSEGDALHS